MSVHPRRDHAELLNCALTRLYRTLAQVNGDSRRPLYAGETTEERTEFALENLQSALVETLWELAEGERSRVMEQVGFYLTVHERGRPLWDPARGRAYMRDALQREEEICLEAFTQHLAAENNLCADGPIRRVAAYWWRRMNMAAVNVAIRMRV